MRSTDVDESQTITSTDARRSPILHRLNMNLIDVLHKQSCRENAALVSRRQLVHSLGFVCHQPLSDKCICNVAFVRAEPWNSNGIQLKLVKQNTSTELHGRLSLNTWSSTFPWKHQTSLSRRTAMQLLRQKNLVQICTHFSARHSSSTMRKTVVDRKQSFKNVSWNTLICRVSRGNPESQKTLFRDSE